MDGNSDNGYSECHESVMNVCVCEQSDREENE